MSHHMMTEAHGGKLHPWNLWFGIYYIGSLVLSSPASPDSNWLFFHVMTANGHMVLALVMVCSLIGTLQLLERKLYWILCRYLYWHHHKPKEIFLCMFEKTSDHVSMKFKQTWLAHYPRPMKIIHGNRGKVTGFAFPPHLLPPLSLEYQGGGYYGSKRFATDTTMISIFC